MLNDPDPELGTAMQLITTVRMLLDPENMLRTSTEKTDFLSFFYRVCVGKLTNYLQQATSTTHIKNDDYRTAHTWVFRCLNPVLTILGSTLFCCCFCLWSNITHITSKITFSTRTHSSEPCYLSTRSTHLCLYQPSGYYGKLLARVTSLTTLIW